MNLAVYFSITEAVARERPESFRPERGFETLTSAMQRCSAPTVEL